jgi:hypothetical protein
LGRISSDRKILLKEIAAPALMIFFDRDSILQTILLMVGYRFTLRLYPKMIHEDRNVATLPK